MLPTPPPITIASGSRMLITAAIASPNFAVRRPNVATASGIASAGAAHDVGQRHVLAGTRVRRIARAPDRRSPSRRSPMRPQ